ncbi:MAG: hypothetical protein VX278_10520 [Myxococcota bacterium]|nr:hypothetical protein [Myxococcota bacterium]
MKNKIVLIGIGPFPSGHTTEMGFAHIRFWSLYHTLTSAGYSVHCSAVPASVDHNLEIDIPSDTLAVVTAGSFAPAQAALQIPRDIPLWLDWPSDPLADLHAKIQAPNAIVSDQDIAYTQSLRESAILRADAIGVISMRQYWVTLSQLLAYDIGDQHLQQRIHYTPIAYHFPHPSSPPQSKTIQRLAICGSANTWLDDQQMKEEIDHALNVHEQLEIHIFGGGVQNHYLAGGERIAAWRHPRIHHHGWLPQSDFLKEIQNCQAGFWIDRPGVEPLLGSRTRAMFFSWMGMDIFGSCQTELMQDLEREQLVSPMLGPGDLARAITAAEHLRKQPKLQDYCRALYAPSEVYAPLLHWLKNPTKRPPARQDLRGQELLEMKSQMQRIYASPTWRVTNRAHQAIKKLWKYIPSADKQGD